MEKDHRAGAAKGDGPAVTKAKEALIAALTEEQKRIPKDHPDWITLENMMEQILLLKDIRVLNGMLESLGDILQRISEERLIEETHK